MTLDEAQNLALDLMDKHYLIQRGWTFNFTNAKTQLGVCKYNQKIIGVSKHHVLSDTFNEIKDTILHEIAHALVGPNNGHNQVWKSKAISIGCNGNRCNTSNIKRKFKGVCPVCDYVCYRQRRDNASCALCSNGIYNEKYKIVWLLNQ